MSLSLKVQLKLNQKLSMTAQLQQSIKLLSLNHQEMKDRIQQELLENPVLQTEEDSYQEDSESLVSNEDKLQEDSESLVSNEDKLQEDAKHLSEQLENSKISSYQSLSREKKDSENTFEQFLSEPVTLRSHLLWQAQVSLLSEESKDILAVLIFNLDERGYLTNSLEELAEKENIPINKLKIVLKDLQNMDPLGVGSRDIKECLLIQACHLQEDTKDMILIINNHLENLKNKDYKVIASDLNIAVEEVLDICQIIQTMAPVPARNFSDQPTEYITPDIHIYKDGNDYKVSLNEDGLPHLQIDSQYKQMLNKSSPQRSDMKRYIKEKVQAGDWFIRSFLQRQETIKKVVESLIKYQKDFLDHGFLHLKPLILQDVAQDISVHISTVSRVTTNKYVYTPQGLVPLKYFFNLGVLNTMGTSISISVIKYRIKEWIEQEDMKHPLSDGDIVQKLLTDLHLSLSRRTVAQYRDSIGISSVNKRKKAS